MERERESGYGGWHRNRFSLIGEDGGKQNLSALSGLLIVHCSPQCCQVLQLRRHIQPASMPFK